MLNEWGFFIVKNHRGVGHLYMCAISSAIAKEVLTNPNEGIS